MNTPHRRTPPGPLLVLNCGSSSIKYALFDGTTQPLPRQPEWQGKAESIDSTQAYDDALLRIREAATAQLAGRPLMAVVHRIVHGGHRYTAPTLLDTAVLADLRQFIPLAPLHLPHALDAVALLLKHMPGVPQVACFDTAFHASLPMEEQLLPLPWSQWEQGVRRYGFHGLSYDYMATALPERHGALARGRTLVAHLGSGASLCAMQGLKSVATTMGFSALDGLMMGTRCGSIDPGAVLHLIDIEGLSTTQVGHLLYHESGLKGVSGLSADPRVLLAQEDVHERAAYALSLYVRRIVREIGALTAVLGGLDLLVFTAGVGENSTELRQRICNGLGFLGARVDPIANASHQALISSHDSLLRVAVEPTNEEWIMARHAMSLLGT
jgi:acetate kinase